MSPPYRAIECHASYDDVPLSPLCQLMVRMVRLRWSLYHDSSDDYKRKCAHNDDTIKQIKQLLTSTQPSSASRESKLMHGNGDDDKKHGKSRGNGNGHGKGVAYGDDRAVWYAIEVNEPALLELLLNAVCRHADSRTLSMIS